MQSNGDLQFKKLSDRFTSRHRTCCIRDIQTETTELEFRTFGVDTADYIKLLLMCGRTNSIDQGKIIQRKICFSEFSENFSLAERIGHSEPTSSHNYQAI